MDHKKDIRDPKSKNENKLKKENNNNNELNK